MHSGDNTRDNANAEALRRLTESDPVLEDVVPAIEALPGMTPNTILASGPLLKRRSRHDMVDRLVT